MPSALVTGASSGIGMAITTGLLDDGWDVTAASRDPNRGADARAYRVACDVTRDDDCVRLVATHHQRFDGMHLLVNGAGVGYAEPIEKLSPHRIERQLAVNLRGMLVILREAVPLLRAARGRIINIASIMGVQGDPALPVYSATKHAVVGVTRSLALALEPDGVRVTALCPSYVNTPMSRWVQDRLAPEAMIQPADMVEAVRFLLRLGPACRVRELVIDGPPLPAAPAQAT